MKTLIFLASLFFTTTAFCKEVNLEDHKNGIWAIAGTAKQNRWLIIHNLSDAKNSGVYHIEVIAKNKKAPVWQIERIVKHMAITPTALRASVIKPLNKGDVYPESFENAFAAWQKENDGKGGVICTTTVLECMF